ncbi:hypothetical protein [Microbulbifer spongiae]|uniref:Uncharacterized protein n=1 Tax=Microbulbifer spongiae TaxID=2944933 RepID=A0ABY9EFA0_9GAMM|nr:hypothetical protein [Microbulbifer sp. MI-G]WKD50718.1 hypothetical protein M8T91_04625 [Microbulbifer sp. MI-G]
MTAVPTAASGAIAKQRPSGRRESYKRYTRSAKTNNDIGKGAFLDQKFIEQRIPNKNGWWHVGRKHQQEASGHHRLYSIGAQ